MQETLGPAVEEYRRLAEVHRDGWGAVWDRSGSMSSYVTHCPASHDPMFLTLAAQVVDSAIVHQRWASPGIGRVLDNQQPFSTGGMGFAHNGTIDNEAGNIVQQPSSFRESLGLTASTTMSDSRLYADLFFLHLEGLCPRLGTSHPGVDEVHQALAKTIATLRKDYPDSSFNNVIETPDFTVATRAHAAHPKPGAKLRQGYEAAGWSQRIATYFELGYTTLRHADGSVTSVASSSGFASNDRWTRLGNNTVLILSHRDAEVHVLPLAI